MAFLAVLSYISSAHILALIALHPQEFDFRNSSVKCNVIKIWSIKSIMRSTGNSSTVYTSTYFWELPCVLVQSLYTSELASLHLPNKPNRHVPNYMKLAASSRRKRDGKLPNRTIFNDDMTHLYHYIQEFTKKNFRVE